MSNESLFNAGSEGLFPKADTERQAVDSLRGYVYQVTAAAIAWLDIGNSERIFLEVAEDYATLAEQVLGTVQVKDTKASGNVTLNTDAVRDAITNFVAHVEKNQRLDVRLEYFTTSGIGRERPSLGFPNNSAGLDYWRQAARSGDIAPLRKILSGDDFPESVRSYVSVRTDELLRTDLLQKIHWNCGAPDLSVLRAEFRERLILVGRDQFSVPATEVGRLSDAILYRVLEKSVEKLPESRVLTRGDLMLTIDGASRLSVPRALIEKLSASGGTGEHGLGATPLTQPSWLTESDGLPKPLRLLGRNSVSSEMEAKLGMHGVCFVSGASGVGKTNLARAVAERVGGRFVTVDFRNAGVLETKSRLTTLLAHLGGLNARTVLLEDLNSLEDPMLETDLSRTVEALRRRDMLLVATCYNAPSNRTLAGSGLVSGCVIQCPYFTEDEARELVVLHRGDANRWGRLAYITAAFGHPQLVHAFIAGMSARGWPESEYVRIVDAGLSSGDVDAERDVARRSIASRLPEGARTLLYRLSLLIGNFDRVLALELANLPPPLDHAGERLDELIGPWLEVVDSGTLRVSPLAAKFGSEMLVPDMRAQVYSVAAEKMMGAETINVGSIDAIVAHAILGKNEGVLTSLTMSLATKNSEVIDNLARTSVIFKVLEFNRPAYPDNITISGMLRLVQFKVIAAGTEKDRIAPCVEALFREVELQPEGPAKEMFRFVSFGSVLNNLGISNHLDDWFEILQKYQRLLKTFPLAASIASKASEVAGDDGTVPVQFAIGTSGISKVSRLEGILIKLDAISVGDRKLYLQMYAEDKTEFAVLVNSPWLAEQQGTFDFLAAADSYKRMAEMTAPWGYRSLTLNCWTARAVMFDEYGEDREAALRALDDAEGVMGKDVLLSRARAKIYWRAQDHVKALSILREIADVVGKENHIERSYALREAAISAAKTGDWSQAGAWFMDAEVASQKSNMEQMRIMAIGLRADAAVAACMAGDRVRGLSLLGQALGQIEKIDPASSLHSAYCHHVVRHTVLWFTSKIEQIPFEVEGEPVRIEPGACSNPEPSESVTKRPLGAVEIAWYMLAQMEATLGVNLGYEKTLRGLLGNEVIPPQEVGLQSNLLMRSAIELDPVAFSDRAWRYAECGVSASGYRERIGENFNAGDPQKESVTALELSPLTALVKECIESAGLAFLICCACKESMDALHPTKSAMTDRFGGDVIAQTILELFDSTAAVKPSRFEEELLMRLRIFDGTRIASPAEYCLAAVQSLQQADRSPMKRQLISLISAWQRGAWRRIVSVQAFFLARPRLSIPDISTALSRQENDERFLCGLLVAICDATSITLPGDMRTSYLRRAAGR